MTYEPAQITSFSAVVARVNNGPLSSDNEDDLKRYTAFCCHPGEEDFEEIDLDAVNAEFARECAVLELAQGYEPGMVVHHVEERFGLYL